jgi:hypothetical protein
VRVTVRRTDVEGTVLKTSWAWPVAGLKTPLRVTEASARFRMRSMALLSMPVTSCTARGVAKSRSVMSFLIALATPAASSTLAVVKPRPLTFAMALLLL